jgi:hypothetical protein
MKGRIIGYTQVPMGSCDEIKVVVNVEIVGNEVDNFVKCCVAHKDYDVEIESAYLKEFSRIKQQWENAWNRVFKNKVNDYKVIFNEPATVLYKDGEKYVSKCDKEDKFSEELGLALCLLKSFGVSYSDFEKFIKGAKRQGVKNDDNGSK